jgi:hypothetical protein
MKVRSGVSIVFPVVLLAAIGLAEPATAETFQLRAQQGVNADRWGGAPAERPSWIPASAFTNDEMICVYAVYGRSYDGKVAALPRRLPNEPHVTTMAANISCYWAPNWNRECKILTNPLIEHPGNYYFVCGSSDGPKGWLQFTGHRGENGFYLYRYWFDKPQSSVRTSKGR